MDIGNGYIVCDNCINELMSLGEDFTIFGSSDICEITIKPPKVLFCYCCDSQIEHKGNLLSFMDVETIMFVWQIFKSLKSFDEMGLDDNVEMKEYIINKIKTFYNQVNHG